MQRYAGVSVLDAVHKNVNHLKVTKQEELIKNNLLRIY